MSASNSFEFKKNIIVLLVILIAYAIGLICYSTFFIFSSNHNPLIQILKISVAAIHFLFLVFPMCLSFSRNKPIYILSLIAVLFIILYFIFLVSFFKYFNFLPNIFSYSIHSLIDFKKVITHYFRQVFGVQEILLLSMFGVFVFVSTEARKANAHFKKPQKLFLVIVSIVVPILFLLTTKSIYGPVGKSINFGDLTIIRRFGPIVHFLVNYNEYKESHGRNYLEQGKDFPGKLADLTNIDNQKAFNLPKIQDVYLIQIESLDSYAVEAKINNNYVMPFLRSMRSSSCINYSNFFSVRGVGGSSDPEFSVITGLLPSIQRQSIRHADSRKTPIIFNMLSELGVKSYFSHNNEFGFYARNKFYTPLNNVVLNFLTVQNESELNFAKRTITEAIDDNTKSFYYFFSFMTHGPYQGYSKDQNFLGEKPDNISSIQYDYFRTLNEVDQMLRELFELQKSDYQNGKNVIIITSDHPSGLFEVTSFYDHLRVPLLICNSKITPYAHKGASGHVDLHSTVVSLFKGNNETIGTDLLSGAPSLTLLRNKKYIALVNERVELFECESNCSSFYKYTDQFIRP